MTLEQFFEQYERNSAAGDAQALAAQYADVFLTAGPNGVQTAKASDLLHVIPRRRQLFASIGWQSTTLVSLAETRLDDRYSVVRTEWRWRLAPSGKGLAELTLPSTFIVERSAEGLRIVFYLAHHDLMTVLRERDLV